MLFLRFHNANPLYLPNNSPMPISKNSEAGLQFSYNLCNLPKQITAENGTSVKYSYFARRC